MTFIKHIYLKGSSIIEVLIALALTSFCGSLAVVIYLNIQKSNPPFFKLKALEIASMCMKETIEKRSLSEESFNAEEFSVKKTISGSETFPDCLNIRIVVFDTHKKKLTELETLVHKTMEGE